MKRLPKVAAEMALHVLAYPHSLGHHRILGVSISFPHLPREQSLQ
jgi:hypothetical protein